MILWKKIFFSFSHWSCFRIVHFGADIGTVISTLSACPIQYHDINTVSSDPTSQMLSPSKQQWISKDQNYSESAPVQGTRHNGAGLLDILIPLTFTCPASSVKVLVTQSCPTFATTWTVAHQAPLSTGFSGQKYWSGLPFPSAGDLPDPRIKTGSLHGFNSH